MNMDLIIHPCAIWRRYFNSCVCAYCTVDMDDTWAFSNSV